MSVDHHVGDVRGTVAAGFEGVRAAYAEVLARGWDGGGALAVWRHGLPVADLVAGHTTGGTERYPANAIQLVFSMTKGLVAVCLADLLDRGLVDLDAPVTRYWPEFASGGKSEVTVATLVSHSAGLIAFDELFDAAGFSDSDAVAARLADQQPRWEPGAAVGYHAYTFGHLVGEVIRRVTGRSVGTYLRERFGDPLGLSTWIGLPPREFARVTGHAYGSDSAPYENAPVDAGPDSLAAAAYRSPTGLAAGEMLRNRALWTMEIPSINAFSDARSLARLYSVFVDGPLRRYDNALVDLVRRPLAQGDDLVLGTPARYGAGFVLAGPGDPMLGAGSFGHHGRGGSLAFAHPESGVTFAYIPTQLIAGPDPAAQRLTVLLDAVRDALD